MSDTLTTLSPGTVILGNCVDVMADFPKESVDLTVTSPPYDSLRNYNGFRFDFPATASELFRVTKRGGVVVWVVADETKDGTESGTSFRQALGFMEIGFKLHDTMIWEKPAFTAVGALRTRYAQVFEYMFVLVKGKLATFNPLKDRPTRGAWTKHGRIRQADGSLKPMSSLGKRLEATHAQRYNVWHVASEMSNLRRCHPAQFPEAIPRDHILSWSNPGDIVLDPFCGSGTTLLAAQRLNRRGIGIEISSEYRDMAIARLGQAA